MLRFKRILVSTTLLLSQISAYAWWDAGHMIVANIAYSNLNSKTKSEVNKLLPLMAQENTSKHKYDYNKSHPNQTFMSLSTWADDLKSYPNYLSTMTTWHYIEDAYSIDDTEIPEIIPRDNAVNAINQLVRSLKSSNANENVKVRNLSLIIHFIGDLHQPLHASELYSVDFPNSDRGGNLYDISYVESGGYQIRNLHKLWDSAINLYPSYGYSYNVNDRSSIEKISKLIMAAVPLSDVSKEAYDLDVSNWQSESHQLGRKAHDTPLGKTPSDSYISNNTKVVERQLALAGYRLANVLNSTL